MTRTVVIERDPESPTGWRGDWLAEADGRVELTTSTPVDLAALADEFNLIVIGRRREAQVR